MGVTSINMTIQYYIGGKIVGLSGDVKPTSVPENTTFIESDTFKEYIFVAGVWELIGSVPPAIPPVSAGLMCWLDANRESSLIKVGNSISQWLDLSGSENNIVQTIVDSRPLWVENGGNGKGTVRFDGIDDVLFRATWTGGTLPHPFTVFIVCTIDTVDKQIFDNGTGSVSLLTVSAGSSYRLFAGTALTIGTLSTDFAQFNCLFDTVNSLLRRNAVDVGASGNTGSDVGNGLTVGANRAQTTFTAYDVSEILIYDVDLSDVDRDTVESYLANKWAV